MPNGILDAAWAWHGPRWTPLSPSSSPLRYAGFGKVVCIVRVEFEVELGVCCRGCFWLSKNLSSVVR